MNKLIQLYLLTIFFFFFIIKRMQYTKKYEDWKRNIFVSLGINLFLYEKFNVIIHEKRALRITK